MENYYCISDCMKTEVIYSQPDMTVRNAALLMAKHNVGTLPVVDESAKLVGVTDMNDIIQIFLPDFVSLVTNIRIVRDYGEVETASPEDLERAGKLKVADIMEEPVSVENDCSLMRALSFMNKYNIRDLPVVEKGKLVGIVSSVDIGRAFLSSWLTKKPA